MKDNFSNQANLYAQYRPEYPQELYNYIFSKLEGNETAWDCATGNGQVAKVLSQHFENVEATDISQKQLDHAHEVHNISYSVSKAETTNFPDHHFDLITVGQAIHWFNFDAFFDEVKRVMKPNGVLAVWGYSTMLVESKIDEINEDFYRNITGPYWDDERKHIDNRYAEIDFPFKQVETQSFEIIKHWDLKTVEGFFNTWSSVQHFIKAEGYNPVPDHIQRLKPLWSGNEVKRVVFPIFLTLCKSEY